MPEQRLTKNDKRDQAREAARQAREKQKRAERVRRWLIPTSVTVAVLAIATVVFLVVSTSAPTATQTSAGPKNMISDGILFTGSGGTMVATKTSAIKAKSTPTPNALDDDGVAHIVTYVDFSCPACQAFEATNSDTIRSLVEQGTATLEVHPIAILDTHYLTSKYSTRANNVGACVANYSPDDFYAVMGQMYTDQPTEGTSGLTDNQIVSVVHKAGLTNASVDSCIRGKKFESWVTAATSRALNSPLPNSASGAAVSGTPTILVNGQTYTGSITDASTFTTFIQTVLSS